MERMGYLARQLVTVVAFVVLLAGSVAPVTAADPEDIQDAKKNIERNQGYVDKAYEKLRQVDADIKKLAESRCRPFPDSVKEEERLYGLAWEDVRIYEKSVQELRTALDEADKDRTNARAAADRGPEVGKPDSDYTDPKGFQKLLDAENAQKAIVEGLEQQRAAAQGGGNKANPRQVDKATLRNLDRQLDAARERHSRTKDSLHNHKDWDTYNDQQGALDRAAERAIADYVKAAEFLQKKLLELEDALRYAANHAGGRYSLELKFNARPCGAATGNKTGGNTTPGNGTGGSSDSGSTIPRTPTPSTDEQDDRDGDGLNDKDEAALGTDPADPDSDHEGLSDWSEVIESGTNPLDADTDSDGLDDELEVNQYSTNPFTPDTDDDGLTDGDEVNEFFTNPAAIDSDGDGIDDATELELGTDPTYPEPSLSDQTQESDPVASTDPLADADPTNPDSVPMEETGE